MSIGYSKEARLSLRKAFRSSTSESFSTLSTASRVMTNPPRMVRVRGSMKTRISPSRSPASSRLISCPSRSKAPEIVTRMEVRIRRSRIRIRGWSNRVVQPLGRDPPDRTGPIEELLNRRVRNHQHQVRRRSRGGAQHQGNGHQTCDSADSRHVSSPTKLSELGILEVDRAQLRLQVDRWARERSPREVEESPPRRGRSRFCEPSYRASRRWTRLSLRASAGRL